MDILDNESLFQSFKRHLKREFSLENINFIVAVVQYRRLCEERTHNSHGTLGMLNRGKNTCQKMQEISMQPSGGSFNSIHLTPTYGPLLNGLNSELDTSLPLRRSAISDVGNMAKYRNKRTPRLSWIES